MNNYQKGEVLWRYELFLDSIDEREYLVVSITACGCWVVWQEQSQFETKPKWMLSSAKRQFACRSKTEALDAFVERKNNRINILFSKISECKMAIRSAELIRAEIDGIKK